MSSFKFEAVIIGCVLCINWIGQCVSGRSDDRYAWRRSRVYGMSKNKIVNTLLFDSIMMNDARLSSHTNAHSIQCRRHSALTMMMLMGLSMGDQKMVEVIIRKSFTQIHPLTLNTNDPTATSLQSQRSTSAKSRRVDVVLRVKNECDGGQTLVLLNHTTKYIIFFHYKIHSQRLILCLFLFLSFTVIMALNKIVYTILQIFVSISLRPFDLFTFRLSAAVRSSNNAIKWNWKQLRRRGLLATTIMTCHCWMQSTALRFFSKSEFLRVRRWRRVFVVKLKLVILWVFSSFLRLASLMMQSISNFIWKCRYRLRCRLTHMKEFLDWN